ncbi:hypothetical protein AAVH_17159 [Aphelenchoides avenae]|nr:hypothetical protein AAVH_17159 [Aphelenchus avenae]
MSITFNELHQRTADETTTVLWMQELGLIEPLICKNGCLDQNGNPRRMSIEKKTSTQLIAVCNPCVYNKRDGAKRGIRSNSWFEGTRLPLSTIMRFVYAWTRDYISSAYCQDELQLSHNSFVDWCASLREVVSWRICWTDEEPIGGPGQTVEIDETLFSRRKNHAGRVLPAKWVFGGICRESRRRFAVCVPDRTACVLLPVIKRWIRPGTKIISDGWKAYQGLANDPDYEWAWVNHSKNFLNPDNPEVHTQTIESTWRPLKEARRKRNGNPPLYNDSYLSEGLWRMNVKDAGQDPFVAIVNDIKAYWKPGNTKAEPFPEVEPLFPDAQ